MHAYWLVELKKWKLRLWQYTCINICDIPKSDGNDKFRWPSPQKANAGLIHSLYPVIATSSLKSLLSIQSQQQNMNNGEREEWQPLTVKVRKGTPVFSADNCENKEWTVYVVLIYMHTVCVAPKYVVTNK